MKNRIGIIVFASAALVFACTQPAEEPAGKTGQSVEVLACAHPICQTGLALSSACDPCATSVCALDPYCCQYSWDATCVGEVTSICHQSCTAPPPPPPPDAGSACAHPLCTPGAALAVGCAPCVTQLCGQDPYCCQVEWDTTCVGEVTSICQQACK